jgi:cell division protein FtsB
MGFSFYRKLGTAAPYRGAWKTVVRNKRSFIAAALVLLAGGYAVFSNHGILMRYKLQRDKAELEAKIKAAEDEGKALKAQSKALDTDKRAVEKVAREKYGMTRQGETVYKVKKEGE